MDLTFRFATPEDAPRVVALVNAAYRVGGGRAWTTEAHLVAGERVTIPKLRALLASEGSAVIVAERAGRVVGCVHVRRVDDRESHLGMLSVDPAEQAGGVGRALIGEAERVARERFGARAMSMTVVSIRSELLAWYERRGYRRTGEVVPFVPPPEERFLAGPLFFERLVKDL